MGERRWGRCGVAAAVALLAVLVAGTGGAAGATALRGPGTPLPGTWLGSYATFDGSPWVWCVDAGRAAPEPRHAWSATRVRAPAVAYLLAEHGGATDPENHAALSYLVHTAADLPHDAVAAVPPEPPQVSGMDLPGRVQELRDEASRTAGPYTLPTSLEVAADGRRAVVTAGVLSAAGHGVAGRAITLSITGPGEWEAGGTDLRATSGDAPSSWRLRATGDGPIGVTVEAAVPGVDVSLLDPGTPGVQRVVAAGEPAAVTGSASGQVRATFDPHVTTRTSEPVTSPGSVLTDVLEVGTRDGTSWPDGLEVEVVSTLWGPFAEQPTEADDAPDGAPEVGRVTSRVDGLGTVTTPGLELPASGYYVWTEQIAADDDQTGWSGRFGLAQETSLARWQPAVETRTSDAVTFPGAELRDHLRVTGLRPGATALVRSILWGPFTGRPEQADAAPAQARQVGTVETEVTAAGSDEISGVGGHSGVGGGSGVVEATTSALVVAEPGWYVWTETIAEDEHHRSWTSPFATVSETTHVPAPPAPPAPPDAPTPPVRPEALPPPAEEVPPPRSAASPLPAASLPAAPLPAGELPRTGVDPVGTASAAAVLLLLGGGLVTAARGRGARGRHRIGAPVAPPAGGGPRLGWVPDRPGGEQPVAGVVGSARAG